MAITITTTLTAIGNYYLDQKDIQEHLDTLMAISALSYQALLGNDIRNRPLGEIQRSLEKIPSEVEHFYKTRYFNPEPPQHLINRFYFQVWTNGDNLLLHSASAPKLPLVDDKDGFSDKTMNNQQWRVFTTYKDKAGIRTVLAERYDTRNELGHRIALDDLYIMLLTFPLSGLLIWIIIGRGLDSLDRVAEEVADRAPSHLEPVDLKEVPEEIKPVIDELNKLFFRLKAGFEREKRFAADAAHELKTPLATLKAQAQLALKSNDIKEKNDALKKLIVSVDRSTHIVQQLLTMSRLVPEAISPQDLELVDLVKLTRETVAMLVPQAVDQNVEIEVKAENKLPKIYALSTAISILIRNVVDNAIRYVKENGHVMVSVSRKGNNIILSVEDNGPGIPEEVRERVFERFYRVLGNKKTGSGLGLAIARQIVQLHGGEVKLYSPKDHTGLIVSAYFPLDYFEHFISDQSKIEEEK